jgi:DNA-binding IclR family transcriptional regulator
MQPTAPTRSQARDSGIQSVRRAGALLRAFAPGAPDLGVAELSRRLNLTKSTVSRLLATLEREGLLERAPGSEKYRLGPEIYRLAGQLPQFADVRAAARPFLVALAEHTRETTNLAVLADGEAYNIDQVSSPHLVGIGSWVGRRTPLHCVANGKALLAHLPLDVCEPLTAGPLAAYTAHTVTEPKTLRAELARVRGQGYATAVGEIEDGLNAVAAPIFDGAGQVAAAISVSGPAYRVTPERLADLGALTARAAAEISARLGYSPAPA